MVRKCREEQELRLEGDRKPIQYQRQMMNAVPWLLPYEWTGEKELVYHRGSGASLRHWLEKEPKEEEVRQLIEAYEGVQTEAEQFLMDKDKFLWDPEWIYWNAEQEKLQLLYCPWDEAGQGSSDLLRQLGLYLWNKSVQHAWKEEGLLIFIFRLNMAARQPEVMLGEWVQSERKAEEKLRIQEEALDILTEQEPTNKAKGWWPKLKEKFPFAFR